MKSLLQSSLRTKDRERRLALLEAGYSITVCSHTVEAIREDLQVLDAAHVDLEVTELPEGMVEVALF